MREENAHRSTIRVIEYSAILVFFLVILIILVPSVQKIVYNMAEDASITNTKATIDAVKTYYTDMNLFNEVALPFKVVFHGKEYDFYEMGNKVNYRKSLTVKNNGKLPTSGSVEITTDGTVTVVNLKFGNFTCNQTNEKNLICENKEAKDNE